MNTKSVLFYGVIGVLSVVVTEIVALIDAIISETLIGGRSGWPLDFSSGGGLEGGGSFNPLNFFIDIIFWFIILLGLVRLLKRLKV